MFLRGERALDGRPLPGKRRCQSGLPEKLVQLDHRQAGDLGEAGSQGGLSCRTGTHDD
jgi:hypothetical protein